MILPIKSWLHWVRIKSTRFNSSHMNSVYSKYNNTQEAHKLSMVCWVQDQSGNTHYTWIQEIIIQKHIGRGDVEEIYSLEFASPTMLSICRSSLNLSSTVPLRASALSSSAFGATPQHSIVSGYILHAFDKGGLPKVVDSKVWPWSKLADRNNPKWFTRPPKPMPLGMLSELKPTAHCKSMNHSKALSLECT